MNARRIHEILLWLLHLHLIMHLNTNKDLKVNTMLNIRFNKKNEVYDFSSKSSLDYKHILLKCCMLALSTNILKYTKIK